MIGIGGLVGLILALSMKLIIDLQIILIILFIVSGLLGTIRLFLNEHKPIQIYSGFVLGFLVVLTTVLFF